MHDAPLNQAFLLQLPSTRCRCFCPQGMSCQGENHLGRQQLALFSPEALPRGRAAQNPQSDHMTTQQGCHQRRSLCSPPDNFHSGSCPHPTSWQSRSSGSRFSDARLCLNACLPYCPKNPERYTQRASHPLSSRLHLCLLSLDNSCLWFHRPFLRLSALSSLCYTGFLSNFIYLLSV